MSVVFSPSPVWGMVFFRLTAGVSAQDVPPWDATLARGTIRTIDFVASEGTAMSVDISPDGGWVVFDLLGHIYRVRAAGGDAECLTQASGVAMNSHPRFSPDGREIAFVSDRRGQLNLWRMDADGSNPRPVFLDDDSRIVEPSWTPDGRFIVATRRAKTAAGFYRVSASLWLFPRDAGGAGSVVVPAGGMQRHWGSTSPDGRHLYFHSFTSAGEMHQIQRANLETGRIESVFPAGGRTFNFPYAASPGQVAPEISPDGRTLAFARKVPSGSLRYRSHEYGPRTALWLKDLETGHERILMDPITSDAMDFQYTQQWRVLPGYGWAKDGKSIVIAQGGKVRRVWVDSGRVETIPFRARVRRTISEQARSQIRIALDSFTVQAMRWPVSSADGKLLVFEAVGRLWIQELPNGRPRLLTQGGHGAATELTPAWSPDGRWIAYATWLDGEGGGLWRIDPNGGAPEQLTAGPNQLLSPSWSPDGRELIVNRANGAIEGGGGWDLVRLTSSAVNGSAPSPQRVYGPTGITRPGYGFDGRIYFNVRRGGGDLIRALSLGETVSPDVGALMSVDRSGAGVREHVSIPGIPRGIAISPGGHWVAYVSEQNVHVAQNTRAILPGGPPAPDRAGGAFRARAITLEGGSYPHWRNDSTLELVAANRYLTFNPSSGRSDTVALTLRLPRATPRGSIALTGARLITLDRRRVIERGTVIVEGGRIACVGTCSARGVGRTIDVTGKTIIPGWVDLHSHQLSFEPVGDGIIPQHRWTSGAYLAYGITTTHDPGIEAADGSYSVGELIEAGRLAGPRTFSGGEFVREFGGIQRLASYRDAETTVNRLVDRGTISIKDFVVATRTQRQWLSEAARRRGVTLTAENQGLEMDLGMIFDGHTGWEHWLQHVPLYSDVTTMLGRAGAHYSGQLYMSGYPHASSISHWLNETRPWDDPKAQRFTPWTRLATRRVYTTRPRREYSFPILAEGAADIVRAGGFFAVGGHSEQPGLDTHWEVWSYASAAGPMMALEAASMGGAHFLGLEREIGSVEVGKIADLMVLDANPLTDIRNTRSIRYTMKAGVLYDARTADEVWPEPRPYGVRPWAVDDAFRADERRNDLWDAPASGRREPARLPVQPERQP